MSPGKLRAVAADQWHPGKPGRLQGLRQSHKEGGESGHVCARGSLVPGVPWVSLCSAVEVAVPRVTALSQYAEGGEEERSSSCWHCSSLKCICDGHGMVNNWSNVCGIILREIPNSGSQALPPS